MKKIGFIGAYDKIDLVIYVAKIATMLKKSVLVIDATTNQKAKYIIPRMTPTFKYITEYEEIDIAVGFSDMGEIRNYLSLGANQDLEYDYIFVDSDNANSFQKYELENSDQNYFVTSFDIYSLKKGLEIFLGQKKTVNLTKILFSETQDKEEDDYLNFLSLGYAINWDDKRIYFPIENGDLTVIQENQRVAKVKFRKLSVNYKDGLDYLSEEILEGEESVASVRRAIKMIERGM